MTGVEVAGITSTRIHTGTVLHRNQFLLVPAPREKTHGAGRMREGDGRHCESPLSAARLSTPSSALNLVLCAWLVGSSCTERASQQQYNLSAWLDHDSSSYCTDDNLSFEYFVPGLLK